jgi:hypothetical protein
VIHRPPPSAPLDGSTAIARAGIRRFEKASYQWNAAYCIDQPRRPRGGFTRWRPQQIVDSHLDLDGAKAANAIKQDAEQRFIDGLDTIDWPAQFEGQVNVVRDNLRKVIEFDRRQVNVATTAQIVDGAEGATLIRAVDDAVGSL